MATQNEQAFREKVKGFDWHGVKLPEGCHEGLIRYVVYGICPGNFLTAVLSNDLKEAFARADQDNKAAMAAWVGFLYNHCPGSCWGSPEKMKSWIDLARASR